MSTVTNKSLEEDGRSFEGNTDREGEEGFFHFREEESCSSLHQTSPWSPFEDLDDSGHFTASPDGERALSGSSRSHSPCPSSAHLLLQMQHTESNSASLQHTQLHSTQMQYNSKPLISPRSVMTVKVPHQNGSTLDENQEFPGDMHPPKGSSAFDHGEGPIPHVEGFSHTNVGRNGEMLFSLNPRESDESSEYLRNILDNFNSLYIEKLRMIDDIPTTSTEQKMFLLEKKTNMLENWAKDVCVQNMVLVHTVEELEKEANRKVAALQTKITESTQLAKEHMNMIKKYEQQVKLLLKNHSDAEEKNLVLKIDLEKLKSECRRVKDRMNSLLKDNESVITLVCRIRDMGVWDVNGLELQRSSFDQIFGLYPNLVGGEVQTVFTKEKAKHVQETEDKVQRLETELRNLHRSYNEAEASSLIKERKFEELETEIKNLSNKIKYSEQECNDYKRSLLETQEKLLEATRRLNSSKYSSQSQSPKKSEMAELIKELRDVKSQLNTAVEEKQSAKEESNYFKRELSERLREMHDIQNVFQSLATEVVNSRTAFQQVQEKEIQLQSLKSEVQTYQSRCSDAEDTIRRKEKEIKLLQKQMNEIHKRNYTKQPSVTSNPTLSVAEGPESPLHTSYSNQVKVRNISSPTKIPVRVNKPKCRDSEVLGKSKNLYTVSNHQLNMNTSFGRSSSIKSIHDSDNGDRPKWNTNFKSLGLVSQPPPAVKKSSRSSLSKASVDEVSFRKSPSLDPVDDIGNLGWGCEKIIDKLEDIEQKLASSPIPISKKSKQSLHKKESDSKLKETAKNEVIRLPKVTTKPPIIDQPPKPGSAESGLNGQKLPKVKATKVTPRKPPHGRTKNPDFKNLLQNPFATTPRINELINAVVETSKQLLGNESDTPEARKKDISSFTITAARYHKNKNRNERKVHRTQSTEKEAELGRESSHEGGGGAGDAMDTVREESKRMKVHSSAVNLGKRNKSKPKSRECESIEEKPIETKDILENLPEDTHDDIVKSWIRRSSMHSIHGKQESDGKPPPVKVSRKPSVKVMKHLATRRFPIRLNSAESKRSSERTEDLRTEMFELEDEWGKVFANLECKTNGATPTKSVKAKEKRMEQSDGPSNGSSAEGFHSPSMESSNGHSLQSNATLCQDEPIHKLLNRLTAEKQEMEERYKKQMQEKDIELKMQKVTIQHLQDAYVALKRGQPIPVPQNVTGNKIMVNGSSNGHHNQVLDV